MSGVLALVILTILLCLLLIYFQIEAIKARDELREYKSYCNLSFEAIKAQNEFKRHCSLPKSHFIFDSRNQMIEHIATKLIPSIIFAKNASLGMLYKVSLMSLKKMVASRSG